jgi:hypothetical protein
VTSLAAIVMAVTTCCLVYPGALLGVNYFELCLLFLCGVMLVGLSEPSPPALAAFRAWTTKCPVGRRSGTTEMECLQLQRDVCGRKDVLCSTPGIVSGSGRSVMFRDSSGAEVAEGDTKTQNICFKAGVNRGFCRCPDGKLVKGVAPGLQLCP